MVPNDDTSNRLIDHSYGQGAGWSSHSQEITIPNSANFLRVWLYPNVGNNAVGYSYFDNLIVSKVNSGSSSSQVADSQSEIISNMLQDKSAKVLSVYPNPASTEVEIGFKESTTTSAIFVYDLQGRLVHSVPANEEQSIDAYQMNIGNLPNGIYFVKTFDSTGVPYQKKMVINH